MPVHPHGMRTWRFRRIHRIFNRAPDSSSDECGDMVKVSLIKTITRVELRRLAQIFIREVKVRKDGIDLVVRGDGFKKLMGKE